MVVALLLLLSACNSTKHVPKGSYLLKNYGVKVKSDKTITNKGVLQDQLDMLVAQKPNTYWSGLFPFKLWKYNLRSDKYLNNPNLELPKAIEKPVIYDTLLQLKTAANMRSFLQNQGYFHAEVKDTVRYKKNKAYVSYAVNTGVNFVIDQVNIAVDKPEIAAIVNEGMENTKLTNGLPYTKAVIDEERARIITQLQNRGYYNFGQDNVTFVLDTINKEKFRDAESLFESAVNFITLQKKQKKLSLNIQVSISDNNESLSYAQYKVGRIIVFPDFVDREMTRDSNLIKKEQDGISFRYLNYYVRETILSKQIFLKPGALYSRADHELTLNKLNELGIFQMVNIYFAKDTTSPDQNLLNCYITLSPSKRLDASGSLEIANATTYVLGNSIGAVYRDKNFFKGANMLSLSATGGVEMGFFDTLGTKFLDHFYLQSTNIGVNATIIFPKFISPFKPRWISERNLPRTQLIVGVNVLNRINQFVLPNINASYAYNWRKSITQTWELTPAFANIVIPTIQPDFQKRLDSNDFLRNTYRRTLIQGENIAFTFSDQIKKQGRNFNYIRIAFEESGIILGGLNEVQKSISKSQGFIFDQYFKIDLDARRYFNWRHSLTAFRFLAGIGSPYGSSRTLPYIKQYFVGGPYSIRGWRPRTLGPESITSTDSLVIDRTGDIKLEMNAEYRFDMIKLFSGTLNLNGALFADAGNTWLAKKSESAPNGQFDISRLGQDIAVSTGAGLRVIVADFFTVRVDAAFPIKNPYIDANNGWVIKDVDLGNNQWRSNNVVINLAIGMPF